jgi:hypothetical protein
MASEQKWVPALASLMVTLDQERIDRSSEGTR